MRIQCNKFPDTILEPERIEIDESGDEPVEVVIPAVIEPSCRFYAFPEGKDRVKVQVDGSVDFNAIKAEFKAQKVEVSEAELKAAYGA